LGDKDNWLLQCGDILISHINSRKHLGKCAIYLKNESLIHGMNLLCLRCDRGRANPFYVHYILSSPQFRTQLSKITKDSVNQSSFNIGGFLDLKIPIPYPGDPEKSLAEQKRIAGILDKADEIRRKRAKAIDLANEFIKSTFLEMFGDPVTNPREWDVKKFGDRKIGTLERGKSKHRPRNDKKLLGGRHPLVQTGGVANSGGYITEYKQTYSDIGLAQSMMWPTGTLCITIAANIAKTGILTFDACFPDSVVGYTCGELATVEYIQYWIGFLQKILEASAPESAQKNINLDILRKLDVPTPPIELQQKFATIVEKQRKMIETMEQEKEAADDLFNALVQKAFKGEL
jgi:type I restriction enzyme S subunit